MPLRSFQRTQRIIISDSRRRAMLYFIETTIIFVFDFFLYVFVAKMLIAFFFYFFVTKMLIRFLSGLSTGMRTPLTTYTASKAPMVQTKELTQHQHQQQLSVSSRTDQFNALQDGVDRVLETGRVAQVRTRQRLIAYACKLKHSFNVYFRGIACLVC